MRVCSLPEYLLIFRSTVSKARDLNFSSCRRQFSILVRLNERVVIMLTYAEFIEMKRMSVIYSFGGSFACIQLRMRTFVYALVVLLPLGREELIAV